MTVRRLGIVLVLLGVIGCSGPMMPGKRAASTPPLEGMLPSEIVRIAKEYVGVPYVWGGASPSGFDCSGFVAYVYSKVGLSIPHSVAKQYAYGTPVSKADLRPGDLVFFDGLRHNGIYIGGGDFVHAARSGRAVRISRLDEDWFRKRWVGARRL
jgi:peptidoglycan DL-endopeptidase CwlO